MRTYSNSEWDRQGGPHGGPVSETRTLEGPIKVFRPDSGFDELFFLPSCLNLWDVIQHWEGGPCWEAFKLRVQRNESAGGGSEVSRGGQTTLTAPLLPQPPDARDPAGTKETVSDPQNRALPLSARGLSLIL